MIVALDQKHVGAEPSGGDRGGRPGGPPADHQHVGLGKDRNVACRLAKRPRRPRDARAAAAGEQLEPLLGPDGAGKAAASRRLAKYLGLPGRSARAVVLVVAHGPIIRGARASSSLRAADDQSQAAVCACGSQAKLRIDATEVTKT